MSQIYEELAARNFIKQVVDEKNLRQKLADGQVVFYVGFDPTADSLHIGSLMPIMAMMHLQRAGHMPICIIGGGTALIGDPSGKSAMRQMLSREAIDVNGQKILAQLQRYLTLDGKAGIFLNNAEWISSLNYVEFLRDIGRHFRVNDMLRNEGYRLRLEREDGLSFIEFNYQLLQAYDFLVLSDRYKCALQMGGDDQWGNILAGVDLIHRMRGRGNAEAYGATFPLLVTARGQKMGKTEAGTIWLDANRISPYEFYQYWMNVDDRDVERFLNYFTFVPRDEIKNLCSGTGQKLNQAKKRLAFETTALTHGEEAARKTAQSAEAVFGGGGDLSELPSVTISRVNLEHVSIVQLLVQLGAASSNSDASRVIKQKGIYLDDVPIASAAVKPGVLLKDRSGAVFRRGKKQHFRLVIS